MQEDKVRLQTFLFTLLFAYVLIITLIIWGGGGKLSHATWNLVKTVCFLIIIPLVFSSRGRSAPPQYNQVGFLNVYKIKSILSNITKNTG